MICKLPRGFFCFLDDLMMLGPPLHIHSLDRVYIDASIWECARAYSAEISVSFIASFLSSLSSPGEMRAGGLVDVGVRDDAAELREFVITSD